jgi:hypothetical protein
MPRAVQRKKSVPAVAIEAAIHSLRGESVILDADLAKIYSVETKALNRAVKRNGAKFPPEFMFQLTKQEGASLRCQVGTSKAGRGGRRYLPFAFTEHGAIMAANVLHSPQAVQMSVFLVRAFIKMRSALTDTRELARKLAALEDALKGAASTRTSPQLSTCSSASWPCWIHRRRRPSHRGLKWDFTPRSQLTGPNPVESDFSDQYLFSLHWRLD